MWLHIPQSHSVPASECLTPESISRSAENLSRFCTWNAKHSAPRTWIGRLKKNSWLKRLSGLTLEPSQAQSAAITFAQHLAAESSTSLSEESLVLQRGQWCSQSQAIDQSRTSESEILCLPILEDGEKLPIRCEDIVKKLIQSTHKEQLELQRHLSIRFIVEEEAETTGEDCSETMNGLMLENSTKIVLQVKFYPMNQAETMQSIPPVSGGWSEDIWQTDICVIEVVEPKTKTIPITGASIEETINRRQSQSFAVTTMKAITCKGKSTMQDSKRVRKDMALQQNSSYIKQSYQNSLNDLDVTPAEKQSQGTYLNCLQTNPEHCLMGFFLEMVISAKEQGIENLQQSANRWLLVLFCLPKEHSALLPASDFAMFLRKKIYKEELLIKKDFTLFQFQHQIELRLSTENMVGNKLEELSQMEDAMFTISASKTMNPISLKIVSSTIASRSPMPENDLAATMNAIYGPQRLQQLRAINPALCSSRMWKEWRLTLTGQGESFQTWKALAIELRRDYSRRKNAARTRVENAGSFWGSPTSADLKGGNDAPAKGRLKYQLIVWPTPKARQTEGSGLTTGRPNYKTTNLKWHAENWPQSTTPQQEMTSELGQLLQKWTPPECPRLNPRFAEWLMGWPIGICSFTLSETELTHWLQHTLSALFGLVCRKIETIDNNQIEFFK